METIKPINNHRDRHLPTADLDAAAPVAPAAVAAAQTKPAAAASFIDRRSTPLGVLPPHLQLWLLIGVAVVMVGIMSISGDRTPPRTASASAASAALPMPSAAAITDANQQRIEEYEQRIQEQAERLAGEQAELHVAKQALGVPSDPSAQSPRAESPDPRAESQEPRDRLERAYRSLFADNVAFSRGQQASQQPPQQPTPQQPAPQQPVPQQLPAPSANPAPPGDATYRISEGSIIETVLTNRLDGTFAGPVNCLVTTPVYAEDRQRLLIPAGARALGDAVAVNAFGQSRLAVAFHRLLLANGRRIDLQSFHGLNQIGETGLRDLVNQHYAQIFGASLAIGAIAGLSEMRTAAGVDTTAFDSYRQGGAASLAQSSAHILDRFLNVLPTVTIREGQRIKIYLANDLDVPEYRDTIPPTGGRQ